MAEVVTAGSVTWSVATGGGAISGSGLFTAGTAVGSYPSTVHATIGGVLGTASVTRTTPAWSAGGSARIMQI